MPFVQFLRFDLDGSRALRVCVFHTRLPRPGFCKAIGSTFQTAGHAIEEVLLLGLSCMSAYRVWLVRKNRVYRVVPRVQVQELIDKLASHEAAKIMLVDVRSHGYYDADTARIKGSIRIEPSNLERGTSESCRRTGTFICTVLEYAKATSARVAHMLREKGFNAFIFVGGLAAWRKAGQPLESSPARRSGEVADVC